ncbi:MAG TPA: hypothetical protein DHV69_04570 [Sphaerochaeta sp.]|nr:MAG: hypothetical protein A2101_03770 [Spirochaetes bacterium GWF2_52_7]HCJ94491.1 hypothetical protein [Sphaerochaeta sp.]
MNTSGKTVILFFVLVAGCFVLAITLVPIDSQGPLSTVIAITVGTALLSFTFGLVTRDYSWTDRLWSTIPVGYAWIYAAAGAFNPIVTLAAVLVTIWGGRLTFNFARRGGYTGGEDYRWPILRERIGNPVGWQLFNLLFIAGYQQFLFICFTLPLYTMSSLSEARLSTSAIAAAVLLLAFLTLETIADQQQFEFQQSKYGLLSKRTEFQSDYERGFRTSGLFSRSRHPNYLGELGVWWSMYVLGAIGMGSLLHWSIAGPVLLTLLFIGSTIFTEGITTSKYPGYSEYRKDVWPIFPKLW